MRTIQSLTEHEKQIIVNDFMITIQPADKTAVAIELLACLKNQNISVDSGQLFNQMCEDIEKRYFAK